MVLKECVKFDETDNKTQSHALAYAYSIDFIVSTKTLKSNQQYTHNQPNDFSIKNARNTHLHMKCQLIRKWTVHKNDDVHFEMFPCFNDKRWRWRKNRVLSIFISISIHLFKSKQRNDSLRLQFKGKSICWLVLCRLCWCFMTFKRWFFFQWHFAWIETSYKHKVQLYV